MSLRRTLATFLLLPLITFLEAGAWYGAHAVLFLFRIEDVELGGLGMDSADAISASATARLLVPVAILLGGLLGAAIGSQGLLVLGLLLAAPGMALIGMPAPWLGGLAAALLVLGHGLMRPGLMGSAAAALRGSEHLRTALIALIYTAINLGALLGSTGTAQLRSGLGFGVVFTACAVVMGLALLAAILLVGATLWTRAEVAANPSPALPTGRLLLGAAGLSALVFLPWMGVTQSWDLVWRVFQDAPLPSALEPYWSSINPLMCTLTGVLIALVAGGFHLAKLRLPPLFPLAGGLLLLALGQVSILALGASGTPWPALAGMGVAAVGEALMMVFLFSRMLGDLHWRLAPVVVALWLGLTDAGTQLLGWLGSALQLEWWPQAMGWVGVVSALVAALVLAVVAIPAQRRLWTAAE